MLTKRAFVSAACAGGLASLADGFRSSAQAQPGLLHLTVRSDREPRRMGLGSASSVASWRRRGGIGSLSVRLSYGYICCKIKLK